MACRTGKRLTGQRIAEGLKAETTLILLPSLLPLSKTSYNGTSNDEVPFAFLPVYSNATVINSKLDMAEL